MSLRDDLADVVHPWVCADPGESLAENVRKVVDAVLRRLGFVVCSTCHGSGTQSARATGTRTTTGFDTCPDCGGLGVRPSDEMIERAARAWVTARKPNKKFEMSRQFRLRARAALLAGIGGQK